MIDQLSAYFESIYHDEKKGGLTPYPNGAKDHDNLLDMLRKYNGTKLWIRVNNSAELWTVPFVSMLLADVSIFHGGGSDNKEDVIYRIQFYQKPSSMKPFIATGELVNKIRGKPIIGGFLFFPDEICRRWIDDFKDIINDGHGLYIPERIVMWKESQKKWRYDDIAQSQPGHILNYPSGDQNNICGVINEPSEIRATQLLEILPIDVPVLMGVPFNKFYRFFKDMENEVLQFRSAIKETIMSIKTEIKDTDQQKAIQIASQIRNDIMRPHIAKIEQSYQRILKSSFTSIAGAAIATIPLILTSIYQPSIQAYVAMLGVTGGLVFPKYAEYQEKIGKLKENPYYILWKIKHINNPWQG